jgi:hypothetical protein
MSNTLDDRIAAIRERAEHEVVGLLSDEEERLAVLGRRLEEVRDALAAREAELQSIAAGLERAMDGFHDELGRLAALGPMPSVAGDESAESAATPAPRAPIERVLVSTAVEAHVLSVAADEAAPGAVAARRAGTTRLRGVAPATGSSPAGLRRRGRGTDSDEALDRARLAALDMAARGRSRDEVVAHVRDELGVTDPAAIIDYVFGASTPSSVVPGWPPRRRLRRSA